MPEALAQTLEQARNVTVVENFRENAEWLKFTAFSLLKEFPTYLKNYSLSMKYHDLFRKKTTP